MGLRLDYLQLPVLARLHLPAVGTVRPSLFAGPAVAFEIGCTVQTASEEIALTLGCGTDDDGRTRTDWSVLLGGGGAYRVGGGAVRLEGRYDIGLAEIDDISGLEAPESRPANP